MENIVGKPAKTISKKTTFKKAALTDRLLPAYCSPEVFEEEVFTQKSDMWALGVMLYQAFSEGKHPF